MSTAIAGPGFQVPDDPSLDHVSWRRLPAFRSWMIEQAQAHRRADEFVQGAYDLPPGTVPEWNHDEPPADHWRHCSVGCCIKSLRRLGNDFSELAFDDIDGMAQILGVPLWVVSLQERIFERLAKPEAMGWTESFFCALPVDLTEQDLERFWWKFVAHTLLDLAELASVPHPEWLEELAQQLQTGLTRPQVSALLDKFQTRTWPGSGGRQIRSLLSTLGGTRPNYPIDLATARAYIIAPDPDARFTEELSAISRLLLRDLAMTHSSLWPEPPPYMKLAEQLRFRIRAVKAGRPDGYGDLHSLRNLVRMAERSIQEMEPCAKEYRAYTRREPDALIESTLAEHDDLCRAVEAAKKVPHL